MLNQDVLWEVKAPINLFGDFTYTEAETIKCRKEPHVEEIRDEQGNIHMSKHIFYTRSKVDVDDKLDGELVVQKYDMMTLGGNFHLRRLITI